MGLRIASEMVGLVWQHPFVSCCVLVLFTPPFFPIVKYFSPLLISTGLCILALVSMGPSKQGPPAEMDAELRRTPEVKVWEDKAARRIDRDAYIDGERLSKRRKSGREESWMEWMKSIEENSLAWVESKLKNESWRGSFLNDENVSILQEAFKPTKLTSDVSVEKNVGSDRSPAQDTAKDLGSEESVGKELVPYIQAVPATDSVDGSSGGQDGSAAPMDHAEDGTRENRPVLPASEGPKPAVDAIQILKSEEPGPLSPYVDLDDSPHLGTKEAETKAAEAMLVGVLRNFTNDDDLDSPIVESLSTSDKIAAMEALAQAMDVAPGDKSPIIRALQPTTAEQVTDITEKLKEFVEGNSHVDPLPPRPESPLFLPASGRKARVMQDLPPTEAASSAEEEVSSDSDIDYEIFPPVMPPDLEMKLHPPVKLRHEIQPSEQKTKLSA